VAEYRKIEIHGVPRKATHALVAEVSRIDGKDIMMTEYNNATQVFTIYAAGRDLTAYLATLRTKVQSRFGKPPDLDSSTNAGASKVGLRGRGVKLQAR